MKLQHKPSDSPSQYGGHGVRTTPGDVVDTEEIDSDEDADEIGEALLETGYFQRADESTDENTSDENAATDVPFDPADYTVDELREELTTTDYTPAEMEALADVENVGKNRDGAIDLLSPTPPMTGGAVEAEDEDESDEE